MRDVYITLGFFAFFNLCLCGWCWLGYRLIVSATNLNEPGVGGAGFILGALWAFALVGIARTVREVGRDLAAELERAKRERGR